MWQTFPQSGLAGRCGSDTASPFRWPSACGNAHEQRSRVVARRRSTPAGGAEDGGAVQLDRALFRWAIDGQHLERANSGGQHDANDVTDSSFDESAPDR
jgi:hypothetical protein